MKLKIFTLLSLLLCATMLHGQQKDSTRAVSYKPQVYGAVKAKLEVSLYDGEYRFNVRNSRLGVKGMVSPRMRYAIQIDFNNEGKVSILDSYAGYMHKNFEIVIGQQQYKFNTDLDRGPNTNFFANRSFLAKFLTTYYGSELSSSGKESQYVKTLGSRDIGALASYKINSAVPLKLSLGAFNGSGTNNPEWANNVNVIARVDVGGDKGLAGSVSHYNGRTPKVGSYQPATEEDAANVVQQYQDMLMWGAEMRYNTNNLLLEAHYAQRRLRNTQLHLLQTVVLQGLYKFSLSKSSFANYICPLARWDMGDNIEYLSSLTKRIAEFSATRATVGVNFGFDTKLVNSEIRFNYEKYMFRNRPADLSINKLLQDKFTIEIVAAF